MTADDSIALDEGATATTLVGGLVTVEGQTGSVASGTVSEAIDESGNTHIRSYPAKDTETKDEPTASSSGSGSSPESEVEDLIGSDADPDGGINTLTQDLDIGPTSQGDLGRQTNDALQLLKKMTALAETIGTDPEKTISDLIVPEDIPNWNELYASFSAELDDLLRQISNTPDPADKEVAIQATAASGLVLSLTVGYVSWLLRAGSLGISLFSMLPLWQHIDPLPVLLRNDPDEDTEDLLNRQTGMENVKDMDEDQPDLDDLQSDWLVDDLFETEAQQGLVDLDQDS